MKFIVFILTFLVFFNIAFADDEEEEELSSTTRYGVGGLEYAKYGRFDTETGVSSKRICDLCGDDDNSAQSCPKCHDFPKFVVKDKCPKCVIGKKTKKVVKKVPKKSAPKKVPKPVVKRDVIVKKYYIQKEIEQPRCEECHTSININIDNVVKKEENSGCESGLCE